MKKRILALALSTAMILSAAPLSVFAGIETTDGATTITGEANKVVILRKSNSQVDDWDEQLKALNSEKTTAPWEKGPQGPQWYYGARKSNGDANTHIYERFEDAAWNSKGWWAGVKGGEDENTTTDPFNAKYGTVAAEKGVLTIGREGESTGGYDYPYMEYKAPISGTVEVSFEPFDLGDNHYTGFPQPRKSGDNSDYFFAVDKVNSENNTTRLNRYSIPAGGELFKVNGKVQIPSELTDIEVSAGDRIRFSIEPGANMGTEKQVALNPVILYTAVTQSLGNVTVSGPGKVILGDLPNAEGAMPVENVGQTNIISTVKVNNNAVLEVADKDTLTLDTPITTQNGDRISVPAGKTGFEGKTTIKPTDNSLTVVGTVGNIDAKTLTVTVGDGTTTTVTGDITAPEDGTVDVKNKSETGKVTVGTDPQAVIEKPADGSNNQGPFKVEPGAKDPKKTKVTVGDDDGTGGKTGNISTGGDGEVAVKPNAGAGDITVNGNGEATVGENGKAGTITVGTGDDKITVEGDPQRDGKVTGPVTVVNDGKNQGDKHVSVGQPDTTTPPPGGNGTPGKVGDVDAPTGTDVTVVKDSTIGTITVKGNPNDTVVKPVGVDDNTPTAQVDKDIHITGDGNGDGTPAGTVKEDDTVVTPEQPGTSITVEEKTTTGGGTGGADEPGTGGDEPGTTERTPLTIDGLTVTLDAEAKKATVKEETGLDSIYKDDNTNTYIIGFFKDDTLVDYKKLDKFTEEVLKSDGYTTTATVDRATLFVLNKTTYAYVGAADDQATINMLKQPAA